MPKKYDLNELIAASSAAKKFCVSRQVFANYQSRHNDFPKPVAVFATTPVWVTTDLTIWFDKHRERIQKSREMEILRLRERLEKLETEYDKACD